jgi:hypothetical protein
LQFLAGAAWVLFGAWCMSLSQVYVDKLHSARFKGQLVDLLPDVGFQFLPHLLLPRLPDVWQVLMVICTAIPVLLFHPLKAEITKRFAIVQGLSFLLRAITIMATVLPNPYDSCVNLSREDESTILEAFKVMTGQRITCGDVLFSGHAANLTILALIWQQYGSSFIGSIPQHRRDVSLQNEFVNALALQPATIDWICAVLMPRIFWAVAIMGYFFIICCRFHYTVDVLVGAVVVAQQWGLYHMAIQTPGILSRFPVLQWYEMHGDYQPPAAQRNKYGVLVGDLLDIQKDECCSSDEAVLAAVPIGRGRGDLCRPVVRICVSHYLWHKFLRPWFTLRIYIILTFIFIIFAA